MKATGVIRRIDELGRVVVPKEIRTNLGIKPFEQLEIFIDDENIILKKYSNFTKLIKMANILVDIIGTNFDKDIIITDRESIIATSKKYKNDYLKQTISSYVEKIMNERKRVIESNFLDVEIAKGMVEKVSFVMCPILVNSDVIGLVCVLSDKEKVNEFDEKIVNFIVNFFNKVVED